MDGQTSPIRHAVSDGDVTTRCTQSTIDRSVTIVVIDSPCVPSRRADGAGPCTNPFCVVGGVAVNLHGVPRVTYELDIVPALDEPNLVAIDDGLDPLCVRTSLAEEKRR